MSTNPEDGGLRNTLYKKETRSKRRMTPMRRFAWRIVAAIGVGLIRTFWATCRVVRVIGDAGTPRRLEVAFVEGRQAVQSLRPDWTRPFARYGWAGSAT